MSEEEKSEKFKVYDKRKFDADGNPREPDAEISADSASTVYEQATDDPSSSGSTKSEDINEKGHSGPLPEIDFKTFIVSLGTQALMSLGVLTPQGEEPETNLEAARQLIDIITMLREKTRGNLDAAEITTIDNLLYDLRTSFVEIKKRKEG